MQQTVTLKPELDAVSLTCHSHCGSNPEGSHNERYSILTAAMTLSAISFACPRLCSFEGYTRMQKKDVAGGVRKEKVLLTGSQGPHASAHVRYVYKYFIHLYIHTLC